jgi:hypothetical protein
MKTNLTFNELIRDCRLAANPANKQEQFLSVDVLVQILKVLVEIRDELKKTPKKNDGGGFWPVGGTATPEGEDSEDVVQAPVPFI